MKYLESVKLVQFFLFEHEDIAIKEITGIFGPNASGKSSLVDAVQIAMFGANGNLVNLNAQADERATTRTIRSYCLGMQDESRYVRENATTYITLIWRDSVTKEATSMGVCLYASVDTDKHEVRGRYIVPGIELSMQDHLDIVNNEAQPRTWETFRHQLVERSKMTGIDPLHPDSERYIKSALHLLRGAGGVPSFEAFKSAFKFALRMRFDKSVDHIVRYDVLESRPTNIQKFKEVNDTFRRLREMVNQVKAKINDGEKVAAEYARAEAAEVRAVTWKALACRAERDEAAHQLEMASDEKQSAEDKLNLLDIELKQKNGILDDAKLALEATNGQIMGHSAHQESGALTVEINNSKIEEGKKANEILNSLTLIRKTLREAIASNYLKDSAPKLEAITQGIEAALPKYKDLTKEQLSLLTSPLTKVAKAANNELLQAGKGIGANLNLIERELILSNEALKRVKDGRSRLSFETEGLLKELRDNGINATPVCDLVSITDPSWQPIIEGYLGKNVEALLVGKENELSAFNIYRGLTGPRAIYGAKIVAGSKQHSVISAPGSVAELIEGDDPAAVAYLRKQFGATIRAVTDAEAIEAKSALTQDGMLTHSGEYNRIKPVAISQLKIGGGSFEQKEPLLKEIKTLEFQVTELQGKLDAINLLIAGLNTISSQETVISYLTDACDEMHQWRSKAYTLTAKLNQTADTGYNQLVETADRIKSNISDIEPLVIALIGEIGRAKGYLEQSISKEKVAISKSEMSQKSYVDAEHVDKYDREFASKQLDMLLEKFDDKFLLMKGYCENQTAEASRLKEIAINKAAREIGEFRVIYREQGVIAQDDWRSESAWMKSLLKRLKETELVDYDEQMNEAFKTSQETFRTDVAIALNNNIDHLNRSMDRLNKVLSTCPVFSNGERYQFIRTVRPQLRGLLKYVKDIASFGPNDSLFGSAGEIPEDFRQLLDDKVSPGAAGIASPLDDYREFFEFDIEILREDSSSKVSSHVGSLSKRLGTGSGGEHRAPLYVIAGAALASAYRLENGKADGMRLILLDEAFNKMDVSNIIATMRYLEELGLQILMVSPGDNLGTLTAFLHRYYDILRDAENSSMMLDGHDVSAATRLIFRSDLAEFNPELIEQEIINMRKEQTAQLTNQAITAF
jgi:hypothetical protein